jgi:hypothetical protein
MPIKKVNNERKSDEISSQPKKKVKLNEENNSNAFNSL